MRRIVLACFLSTLNIQGFAGALSETDQVINKCLMVTDIAKSAVEARQNRVAITEMYRIIVNQDQYVQNVAKVAIDSAYRVPLANTPDQKERVILEYTNNFFSNCMKLLSEDK
ncbi:hypothetical protein [Acinetobacter bereziniae]|jgi:hypothetical protein|uniref:hypothetical protein n=2 Tax=Acinetobacter bereziniae TaxID=106648 RepID=UPI0021E43790|nr:hypothetical protein [Acinetobacter bereziniae]MCV2445589.1 hypothetical protein [Acinetobacter bereziniae]